MLLIYVMTCVQIVVQMKNMQKGKKNSLPPTNAIKFQMHLQCSQNVQIVQYKLKFLEIFFLFHKSHYGSDHFRKMKIFIDFRIFDNLCNLPQVALFGGF